MDPLDRDAREERSPAGAPEPPRRTPRSFVGMGTLIGLGGALGLVFGLLLDNLVLGLAMGAALGTVAGAVVEYNRRR